MPSLSPMLHSRRSVVPRFACALPFLRSLPSQSPAFSILPPSLLTPSLFPSIEVATKIVLFLLCFSASGCPSVAYWHIRCWIGSMDIVAKSKEDVSLPRCEFFFSSFLMTVASLCFSSQIGQQLCIIWAYWDSTCFHFLVVGDMFRIMYLQLR